MSDGSSAYSDELPQPRYEENRVQRLNQLENRIAVAKIELKNTGEKLRKTKKILKNVKDEIADAQKKFWKIEAYVAELERELEPLLPQEQLRLPSYLDESFRFPPK